jgi:energy-coupling factor transporter transmembrane protein EcfT
MISGYYTKKLIFFNLQVMWTVTGVAKLMIAKALRDMHSIWEALFSRGYQRSSPSSHYRLVKPNML